MLACRTSRTSRRRRTRIATAFWTRRTSARMRPRTWTGSRTTTAAPISTTITIASWMRTTSARTSRRPTTGSTTTTAAPTRPAGPCRRSSRGQSASTRAAPSFGVRPRRSSIRWWRSSRSRPATWGLRWPGTPPPTNGARASWPRRAPRRCAVTSSGAACPRRGFARSHSGQRPCAIAASSRKPIGGSMSASTSGGDASTLGGLLQGFDVELHHLHHRLHDPPGFLGVLVADQLHEHGRDDLPRHAELVGEPAAGDLLAAVRGQLAPVIVHLRLRLAVNEQGDPLAEGEARPAVEQDQLLAVERDGRRHPAALRARTGLAVARGVDDLGVLEDGRVEVRRFLGLVVERQKCRDLRHRDSPGLGTPSWRPHCWVGAAPPQSTLPRNFFW